MCLRLAAFVVAAFLASIPLTASALQHVPFTDDNGLIKVQGSVDGMPATMLVDLGAGIDVLSGTLAARTVPITSKYASLRLTGERVDLPIGTVVSLALGEYHVGEHTVAVWPGLNGTGIDGLMAAQAFRDVATTFDFHAHELLIEDQQSFPERKRFSTRVPLVLQDDLGIALGIFARFDFGNGQSGLCVIDTGIPNIEIDNRFAAKLGVNLADPSLKRTHTARGDRVEATIPSLAVNGAPQATLVRPNVVFANLVYDCNVGNQFWSPRGFTLDISSRSMYVPLQD
jgi:aspartyl protease